MDKQTSGLSEQPTTTKAAPAAPQVEKKEVIAVNKVQSKDSEEHRSSINEKETQEADDESDEDN